MQKRLLFLDIETTGLNDTDKIIEIAIYDSARQIALHAVVNPMCKNNGYAFNLIPESEYINKPGFSSVAEKIYNFIGDDAILVAHNASFDWKFLEREMLECGYDIDVPRLCTLELSRAYIKDVVNHKLDTLKEYFSLTKGLKAHRAVNDVKTMFSLFLVLKNNYLPDNYLEKHLKT